MAILVEEEKSRSNITSSLGWLVIVAIILIGAYYVFFSSPTPAVVNPPASLAGLSALSAITFDPSGVLSGSSFQALKQSIPEPIPTGPVPVGRANPFLSP